MSGLDAGSTLGDYTILARLRAGAMGALYLARRAGPGGFARPVAIKVIHEHLAQNKRFCRMFIAEARISARIEDPHVVRVEEFGESDGRYFLVMEFVHGVSLAQALGILRKRGGLPLDVAVAIAMDIASGLHAAHEATDENGQRLGIVHRDVSPHNVLVSYKGHVKVIDFGIAKAKESAGQTLTGSIRGKLAYMPPEQARSAKHVDRRADLYALGLVLWEMLVGRRMFAGKSDIALLNMIRNPTIIAPSAANPRLPKILDAVVLKLLEQDPARRPNSGVEVTRMLAAAWPPATKVLAADIAAAMNVVRTAATTAVAGPPTRVPEAETVTASGAGDDSDSDDDDLLEEVKKGVTLFDQGMLGELGDEVPTALGSNRDATRAGVEVETQARGIAPVDEPELDNATKVMMKPASPSSRAFIAAASQQLKQTMKMDGAPGAVGAPAAARAPVEVDALGPIGQPETHEEITKNHQIQPRPVPGVVLNVENPYVTPAKPAAAPTKTKIPEWLSGWVMLGLTVLFASLLGIAALQCSKSTDSRASKTTLTTAGTANRNRTPLENANEAAAEGNPAAVRGYLEKNVRSGKAPAEEVRLVQQACLQMGDLRCVDDIGKKYPSIPRPTPLMP